MPLLLNEYTEPAAALSELDQVLREDPQVAEAIAAADPDHHRLVVAIFNGRPVAALLLRRDSNQWQAEQLVVHPATRRRGVARELLRLAEQWLEAELSLPQGWRRQTG
jgi:GNAT superfamily N-acetyltransferase